MAKRRPAGDGTVRKRVDGRWEARIVVGHKRDGSPIYKAVTARTQKQAVAGLVELKNMYDGIELTEDSRMTLAEWLNKWMTEYKIPVLRPSTVESYNGEINRYINPHLGDHIITQLKTSDLQKCYNALLAEGRMKKSRKHKGLSAASVRKVHTLLYEALDCAVREGFIPNNPAKGTVLPKIVRQEKKILNLAQMKRLMRILEDNPYWRAFFFTDLMTGMRRGEICGLKWEDFDDTRSTLRVQRTIRYHRGELCVYPPKTEDGKRRICLPDSLWWVLSEHKASAVSEWIFPDPLSPDRPLRPEKAYNKLTSLLKRARLPHIRFHDLRHSFASVSANQGIAPQVLSGIVGHSKTSFTLDTYAHVTTDMHRNAARIVESYITDIFGKELKPWQDQNGVKTATAP